jgi:flagellar hook-associated protein 3 FlgL
MRVANNTVSESIVRQIQQLSNQQSKLQAQVASGQRIFQPEDDPTAVGRMLNLESEQRGIQQYARNASHALELSQVSFAGLKGLKTVSDRATEIGTLVTGSLSAQARASYGTELNQLIEQALQASNTKFGDDYVFAGTAVDQPPFTAARDGQGNIAVVSYVGNAAGMPIALSDTTTITPSTSGATNLGIRDFINQLVTLRDAINANNSPAIGTAQAALLASEDPLVASMAEQGGLQLRIEASQAQLTDRSDRVEGEVSSEVDADLSSTIVRLNQNQTAYQAALQSAASIMRISLLDYIH